MAFFVVSVDLTEEGSQHTDDIVDLIFQVQDCFMNLLLVMMINFLQYINMLKREGPKEWIFQEYGELAKMHFRFKDREIPRSLVVNVVDDLLVSCVRKLKKLVSKQALQEYPTEEVLAANYLVSEWKPELITEVLSKLTADNCRSASKKENFRLSLIVSCYFRVGIVSKKFESVADQSEKWYGTKYKLEEISPELMKRWQDSVPSNELQIPGRNEFIPSNLDLFPKDDNVKINPTLFDATN